MDCEYYDPIGKVSAELGRAGLVSQLTAGSLVQ